MDNKEIKVTVICMAYNHEKYIRQCLNGFVSQKTNFNFEVIVHDDASTDKTADIIREYEDKYPNLIKGIYQKENQRSKKIRIQQQYILPIARGKFVSRCEGDDYWCSPQKLQNQYDALTMHPECHLAIHTVEIIKENGETTGTYKAKDFYYKNIIPSNDFIYNVLFKDNPHLNSFMVRMEDYRQYLSNPPLYKKCVNFGDIPMALYFGLIAPVYYDNNILSYYRLYSVGSWTSKYKSAGMEANLKHYDQVKQMMIVFDECTNQKYHEWCNFKVKQCEFNTLFIKEEYFKLFRKDYRQILNNLSIRRKVGIILRIFKKYIKISI